MICTLASLALVFLCGGCANIVPPEGGTKDETAPVLLSITPADSSLNITPSKIELRFNEYIEVSELEKNISMAPLLQITPTVISYGKRVEIKIMDTLLPNTTYSIGLGNALVDNHEGNPFKDFIYTFSTGAYFDSLQLRGEVIDAATGMPDTAALVVLYDASENDTAVMRKRPVYAVRASGGSFSFRSLPKKAFRIYAVQDANNNFIYDVGEEKIGFIATSVTPDIGSDSVYRFYTFKEEARIISDTTSETPPGQRDSTETVDRSNKPNFGTAKNEERPKSKDGYRVDVDTNNRTLRTFELTQELTIQLTTQLKSLDTAKVYLSYENNGIEVEAIQKLRADSVAIKISSQWQSDKLYTLRLVKGWAKDTSGAELPPGKYFFRTKREDDYGKLKIHVDSRFTGDSFVLYIYKGADSIYKKPLTDSVISLELMQPGDYGMLLIADGNGNRQWDPGNLLLRKQPERVYPYTPAMIIKAGWDNEIDFHPQDQGKPKGGKPKMGDKAPATTEPVKEKE